MDIWELIKDVETRDFELNNGKEVLKAREKFLNSLFSDDSQFLVKLMENEFMNKRFDFFESAKNLVFQFSSIDEISDIKKKWNKYENELKNASVIDDLEKYLKEQKECTYYYIGINQFVMDY